jgi:acylphosphatase
MEVRLIVHGIVQGVGYRSLVKNAANKHGIRGFVRNVSDGSVEIVAIGDAKSMRDFEREISVNYSYGPQVMHVERKEYEQEDADYAGFRIERDKML